MRKRTRSILEELSNLHSSMPDELIQTRGVNIIESAINLIQRVHETYDVDTAADLERRLLNSIRAGTSKKFKMGMDKIIESRK